MTDDTTTPAAGQFLAVAEVSDAARAIFDEDLADVGFVMNASRLWAYHPEASNNLFSLMSQVTSARPFTTRERGILVTACASTLGARASAARSQPGEHPAVRAVPEAF